MRDIFELVYLIYEDKLKSQREFSLALFMSLGKVNRLIAEAIDLGYIVSNSKYLLTSKGLAFLNAHKVDNAIIMAAGFGSRFVPMTYETPKGLLKVFDEVMIERQIKQLHEVGIKDISIVVGYLKEKFEYLSDKYGVKLIYNPDFVTKNNISSLFYSQDLLKNTYILVSDIYMPDNIFRKYEYQAFYAVEYSEDFIDEWAVDVNKDNLIVDINPSGKAASWFMYGPAYFDKNFSDIFKNLINQYYDDSACADWYWEDILLNNLDELKMYARKYLEGTILEFESLEELRLYDESYLTASNSEILDLIMRIFNVDLVDIKHIETLKEGMTNDSFLFEVNNAKYVFRSPGIGSNELIDRKAEALVYEVIKDYNISDEVVYIDPNRGYKISKYIEGARVIDINSHKEVKMAFAKLRELHSLEVDNLHTFDISSQIERYHALTLQVDGILYNDFELVYADIKLVLDYIAKLERPLTLCHIDAVYTNFLYVDNKVVLLDFEYAGLADSLIDVAMYCVFAECEHSEIDNLTALYLERKPSFEELTIVYSYVALAGFLWSLWTLYKQASGEDFGLYGIVQYQYARNFSRIVIDRIDSNA